MDSNPTASRAALDRDLMSIRDDILRLASLVDQAVDMTFRAFRAGDVRLAQEAVEGDTQLDNLRNKLEADITTTLALQQPMAHDLRVLVADLLIANELERMGDHAEGIARIVLRVVTGLSGIELPVPLASMKERVHEMLREVMEAYSREDPEKAKEVACMDDELDRLYQQLFSLVVGQMGKGELTVERGTYLLWAAHNLERIGDRVTNICERIVYARTGTGGKLNIKHE
jgi:phosphate transport system protein